MISSISNYTPKVELPSLQQAYKNITKLAVPIITFVGASMINTAEAIPYHECIDNCNEHRDAHPIAKLLSYTPCLLFAKD